MSTIEEIIRRLSLVPHPEGGFYRETYRSDEAPAKESDDLNLGRKRVWSTCIYYLLTGDTFSSFHRLWQDEIWHFYDGAACKLHMIFEDGTYAVAVTGRNLVHGEVPQVLVPGGTWMAAEVIEKAGYSLVGCTVSPGFDFADFELAERRKLIAEYPHYTEIIKRLTRA